MNQQPGHPAVAAPSALPEGEAGSFVQRGFVVMLADDDDINREVIGKMLQIFKGVDVVTAEDGAAALTLCLERRFDLLIMDLRMPVITGDKVIRHLRATRNPNSQTPVVLCSAFTESELDRIIGSCPYDKLLGKPVTIAALRLTVTELTGRS